jgi:hypothetical protein
MRNYIFLLMGGIQALHGLASDSLPLARTSIYNLRQVKDRVPAPALSDSTQDPNGQLAEFAVQAKTQNVFIITLDGFRWQEMFQGADSVILSDPRFVKDSSLIRQLFWDPDPETRRRKLMPFFWEVIAKKGQLYGNREFSNKVNVKNLYQISYPGYNEIFTGTTDPHLILNIPIKNKNTNLLEYLNHIKEYRGRVAAFSSWNLFPYILNEKRSQIILNSGYCQMPGEEGDSLTEAINMLEENVYPKTHTRYDWLTYLTAREYIERKHPRIVFLSLGQTDIYAHQGRYDLYLEGASAIDKMIAELWYYTQTQPFYKGNTTFIITTDHGRGNSSSTWVKHGIFTKGSGETWIAMLGQGIVSLGELKTVKQTYQKQIAPTIASLLGQKFELTNSSGKPISLPGNPDYLELGKELPAEIK